MHSSPSFVILNYLVICLFADSLLFVLTMDAQCDFVGTSFLMATVTGTAPSSTPLTLSSFTHSVTQLLQSCSTRLHTKFIVPFAKGFFITISLSSDAQLTACSLLTDLLLVGCGIRDSYLVDIPLTPAHFTAIKSLPSVWYDTVY
jgi:hypothetical protein